TLWGGETLLGAPCAWRRVASLRSFRLPGGDRAAVQPWRCAASLCWHERLPTREGLPWQDEAQNVRFLREAWARGVQSPWTTSVGRLFDAAAALVLGIRESSYEAQGPMQLEALAAKIEPRAASPVALEWQRDTAGLWRLDWAPLLPMLCSAQTPAAVRAACFHESLAAALADLVQRVSVDAPVRAVGLAGGVFQNRRLLESCTERLGAFDRPLLLSEKLPANDASICLGQITEHAGAFRASNAHSAAPC
ncbi:MAG: hypothetical protein WCE48_07415, partial [Steroidobacteraceae bacterium]